MKRCFIVVLVLTTVIGCKKDDDNGSNLPEGAIPYSEADIQFVPYTSGDEKFDRIPLLDSSFTLVFKERLRTEAYYAWDQTFFTFSSDPEKELELRLRYLQTTVSQKTLAIYVPYRDLSGNLQTNLFEIPIEYPDSIEFGYFADLIDYYDTLVISSVEFYNVFEVSPLQLTPSSEDGPENYTRLYYNKVYGIIEMDQKDGSKWFLDQ
ncbi:hypothetical protein JYT74_01070 [Crocinitomix catalasitica]|nr:hypothetical protein [Crocinitomix catalasitica]